MERRVWEEVAKAADGGDGLDAILGAIPDSALVLWRGGWDVKVTGGAPALVEATQKLRNARARVNVMRGLCDREGSYALVPVRRDGQVVGTLIVGEALAEVGEALSIIVSQALAAQSAAERQRGLLHEVWKLKQQLRDAARVRTALLSQARHDLRTPLAAVRGYADMINRGMAGPLNPTLKRYVDRIGAAVEREVQLLDEKLAAAN